MYIHVHIGTHGTYSDIVPSSLAQTNQPRHTAESSIPVHSQQTGGDDYSHKTITDNTTASSSLPMTGTDSKRKQGT